MKQMEGSDYEDMWSQWADDMGCVSNCEKRKDKSKKRKEQGQIVTAYLEVLMMMANSFKKLER